MNRRAFLAGATATLTLGSGCLDVATTSTGSRSYDVGMTTQAFTPQELEVTAGTEVVWKNTSRKTHTVTAYEALIPDDASYFATGGFDSQPAAVEGWLDRLDGGLEQQATFSHTFEVTGTYDYFCIPHERTGMTGRVTVTET